MSHVFPGFLLTFIFFMLIDLFHKKPGYYTGLLENQTFEQVIITISIILIVGAIFGIIIDGIQHILMTSIFEKIYQCTEQSKNIQKIYGIINEKTMENFYKCYGIENGDKEEINKYLKRNYKCGSQKLNWYFYFPFIDTEKFRYYTNEFYYYYEFFTNIFLVFFPMSIILFFYTTEVHKFSSGLSFFISLFIFIVGIFCLYNAWTIFKYCCEIRINIVLGTLSNKKDQLDSYSPAEHRQEL